MDDEWWKNLTTSYIIFHVMWFTIYLDDTVLISKYSI